MSFRSRTMALVLLIVFMMGFSLGLGISYWSKVEWISVAFYSAVLSGITWGGYEVLQAVRSYRLAIAHKLHIASQMNAARVHMPALPFPQVLQVDRALIRMAEDIDEPYITQAKT